MAWIYEITNKQPWGYYSDQALNNVYEVYKWYKDMMTLEALCGIIGNMCYESFMNPGQKQMNSGSGRGLIQWTPSSTLVNYVNTWYDGDEQCELILREGRGEVGGRFFPSATHPQYNFSWSDYCNIGNVDLATKAYFYERERGTWKDARVEMATYYLNKLKGEDPPVPPEPPKKRTKMPLYMYLRRL